MLDLIAAIVLFVAAVVFYFASKLRRGKVYLAGFVDGQECAKREATGIAANHEYLADQLDLRDQQVTWMRNEVRSMQEAMDRILAQMDLVVGGVKPENPDDESSCDDLSEDTSQCESSETHAAHPAGSE